MPETTPDTKMREQIHRRLAELQREHAAGENMVRELETRLADVRATTLRIGGAMQVLRELLATDGDQPADAAVAKM